MLEIMMIDLEGMDVVTDDVINKVATEAFAVLENEKASGKFDYNQKA